MHVTQGTVANLDWSDLVGPALAGLADQEVLVVVSTGNRPVSTLPQPLPANVRVAGFLPYDRLLPLTDVMVTNGGFGGVQHALANGVPLVVAGRSEDKVEVTARVGWTGAGISLRTEKPTAAAVGRAVRAVLDDPSYRKVAQGLATEIAAAPGLAGLADLIEGATP